MFGSNYLGVWLAEVAINGPSEDDVDVSGIELQYTELYIIIDLDILYKFDTQKWCEMHPRQIMMVFVFLGG